MLKYLLLLLITISASGFTDCENYLSVVAEVNHEKHKEFTWPTKDCDYCTEGESKLVLHSDGMAYFSSVLTNDSDKKPGYWWHKFVFTNDAGEWIYISDHFDSPEVRKGQSVHWKIDFSFDSDLFDQIVGGMVVYNCLCTESYFYK